MAWDLNGLICLSLLSSCLNISAICVPVWDGIVRTIDLSRGLSPSKGICNSHWIPLQDLCLLLPHIIVIKELCTQPILEFYWPSKSYEPPALYKIVGLLPPANNLKQPALLETSCPPLVWHCLEVFEPLSWLLHTSTRSGRVSYSLITEVSGTHASLGCFDCRKSNMVSPVFSSQASKSSSSTLPFSRTVKYWTDA